MGLMRISDLAASVVVGCVLGVCAAVQAQGQALDGALDDGVSSASVDLCPGLAMAINAARADDMARLAVAGEDDDGGGGAFAPPPFLSCGRSVEGFDACSLDSGPDGLVWSITRRAPEGGVEPIARGLVDRVERCLADSVFGVDGARVAAPPAMPVLAGWVGDGVGVRVWGRIYGGGQGAVGVSVAPFVEGDIDRADRADLAP